MKPANRWESGDKTQSHIAYIGKYSMAIMNIILATLPRILLVLAFFCEIWHDEKFSGCWFGLGNVLSCGLRRIFSKLNFMIE